MANALIWISLLATSLSLMALVAALAARTGRGWLVWLICLPVVVWLSVGALAMAAIAGFMMILHLERHSMWYFVSLAVIEFPAAWWILCRARKPAADGKLYGERWNALRLGLVFGVCLICGTALLWWVGANARQRVDQIRVAAVERLLEVAPTAPEPEDDAALLYEQAFARLGKESDAEREIMDEFATDFASEEVAALLDSHADALSAIREAARRPRYYIAYPYDRPTYDFQLSSLSPMRRSGMLLRLSARYRLAQGDVDAAIEDVRTLAGMAQHAAEPPMLLHALVAIGIDAVTMETAAEVLAHVSAEKQLARLPVLQAGAAMSSFPRVLRSERAFAFTEMSLLGLPREARTAGVLGEMSWVSPVLWIFWLAPEAEGLDACHTRVAGEVMLPFPEAQLRVDMTVLEAKRQGLFSAVTVPNVTRAMTKHCEEDARRAAYGLAVAATRFHLEHGRWPTDRAELEPTYVREWPRDPLDEAPMRMSSNGDELTFYSVGQDLDDDGGTIVRRDDGDVCVTVKRPVRGTSSSSTQAVQ